MHIPRTWIVAGCLMLPGALRAQYLEASGVSSLHPAGDSALRLPGKFRLGPLAIPRRDSSWWVPLASTVIPGAGQALLGQDRFIAYLAVEAYAVLGFFNQRAEQIRERDRSRALARDVARAQFSGTLPIGPWAYYEEMEKWTESGVFDRIPGGNFTPESDETTYNGDAWLRARLLYWDNPNVEPDHGSPQYQRALSFYLNRAVQPEYRWSWHNAQLEQDLYRRTIRRTNAASQDATTYLIILGANHLLSMVDAFVTLRLRGFAGVDETTGGGKTSFSITVPWAPFGRSAPR